MSQEKQLLFSSKWSPRAFEDALLAITYQASIKEEDGKRDNSTSLPTMSKHPSIVLEPALVTASRPYCGLLNKGGDGYRNSALQLLYNSDAFRRSIEEHRASGPLHKNLDELFQWMRAIANTNSPVANAYSFHKTLVEAMPQLANCNDAQKYLLVLLMAIHREANEPFPSSQAANYALQCVGNSYRLQMALQLQHKATCSSCQHVYTTWSTDWCLSLSVPLVDQDCDFPTTSSCLKSAIESSASSQNICRQCKAVATITRESGIAHVGRLVFLHLCRHPAALILVDEHIRLNNRSFALSAAVYRLETSYKLYRWGALVRQSENAWVELSDCNIIPLTRNDAKQLLDEHGYLLLYEEGNDSSGGHATEGKGKGQAPPKETDSLDIKANICTPFDGFIVPSDAVSKPHGFCGLKNLGLTCYANSCLQVLYNATPIRRYLVDHPANGPFHQLLADLFGDMQTKANFSQVKFKDPVSLKLEKFMTHLCVVKPIFRANQMADAQEFLSILIELLHQEANVAKKRDASAAVAPESKTAADAWHFHVAHTDDSFLSKALMGQVESTLSCITCGHQSKSWSCIWQLQLQLEREKSNESAKAAPVSPAQVLPEVTTLKECVNEYQKEEPLSNDSLPHCAQCNARRPATMHTRICRLASWLLVHLKRFAADGSKLYRPVVIDDYLELAGTRFALSSAVLHCGTENMGHNFTIHREADQRWVQLDDANVTKGLTSEYVAEQLKNNAYLCLYQAMTPQPEKTTN